ncbi:Hypothetical protein CINCED_3A025326 [Cinara cedri]|uniref:Uncharacterized protein n=1 Tax=Cinara cedri TaxID=506608 RepID=A0A5E4NMF9_9HEMI|nr:Hypothetical protein CINCED_3A025326 [Cinara cedri]
MVERDNFEYTMWAEEVFIKNNSIAFQKMKTILELKKLILVLKSKINLAEQQMTKLKEYVPTFESIISKSREYEKLILVLNKKIEDIQDKIENIKKDILEGERVQKNSIKINQKREKTLKKMLSNLYENSYDSQEQKENRLHELEKEAKEYSNPSYVFKERQELDYYIKEFELSKAKNMMLKEMMSMNIKTVANQQRCDPSVSK